ncbi:DNA-3-methyladenine glycosylase [Cyberlindnera fabianii]|uniref:DNA-3-methyladenine glycosylase n=1 Tax=Cyberlindnera fabianii TaxID=36022 RepID=A0A1V2L066_CYBFA|nr:DNA-3-methyladenine glycosylase [Cyberlindnera fabianii]
MSKRILRSSATVVADTTNAAVSVTSTTSLQGSTPSTPKKRKISTIDNLNSRSPTKSPRKPKVSFKDWEQDLLKQHPIPKDLSLPKDFVAAHRPEFIKGLEHVIKVDPSLYPLAINDNFPRFTLEKKPMTTLHDQFGLLCRNIIAQQVSGAAALSIENKFKLLYDGVLPSPDQVLVTNDDLLRSAGLSARKSEYIKSIAQKFVDGEVDDEFFKTASDEEVITKLVEMKGIGEWSAKMFLVFGLHRLDVFAHDDLGVARGMSRYLETRPDKLKLAKHQVDMSLHKKKAKFHDNRKRDWIVIHDAHVNHIADDFKPYRSVFMLLLWRASYTNIEILNS